MRFCSLASGSSGNSIYIESEQNRVLVDAGLSGKAIEERLSAINVDPKELTGIFVSHEHVDHIKGVGVLSRKHNLPVYATEATWNELGSIGKVSEENRKYICDQAGEDLDDLKVEFFSVSHDAADPIGFSFFNGNHRIGIATDTGVLSSKMLKNLVGSDLLYIEANYDDKMLELGSYPRHLKQRIKSQKGHLSNGDSGLSLAQLITGKTKKVTLAHLSAENNLPKLAYHTIKDILEDINLQVNRDLQLDVAPRETPGTVVELK